MKTALIIGADEFLGLSLCERLMDEGVHVDVILAEPEDKTRRLYLEERLMWLARNGLFQIIDEIGEKEYDRICVQYGSGCLPEERAEPLYWIVYSEDHGDWEKTVSGIRQKRLSFLPSTVRGRKQKKMAKAGSI